MNGNYLYVVHSPGEILQGSWLTSVEVWAAMGRARTDGSCGVRWGGFQNDSLDETGKVASDR